MSKVVVIRVRTAIMNTKKIHSTLKMLNLHKKYFCSLINKTPSNEGMLQKVKGFITWGEIDEETEKSLTKNVERKFYRLHPPRGGFERKGIKMPFALGGALGDRGIKINDLIKRMLP